VVPGVTAYRLPGQDKQLLRPRPKAPSSFRKTSLDCCTGKQAHKAARLRSGSDVQANADALPVRPKRNQGEAPMKYKVTVEILSAQYQREYNSDAGPTEILARIRDAVEAKPAVP
jgi:hypothetical protein